VGAIGDARRITRTLRLVGTPAILPSVLKSQRDDNPQRGLDLAVLC